MSNLLKKAGVFLEEWWSRIKVVSDERKRRETEVNQAIERVVEESDPRIRGLVGYRRKLYPVVEKVLDYSQALAQRLPEPVQFDRQSWSDNPLVNALFGSPDKLRWCLSGPEVRRFIKGCSLSVDQCYGIFLAHPHVRHQLGMELSANQVRRDVKQTIVSFSGQEVTLLGETEAAVRTAAADAVLETLVGFAVEEIAAQETRVAASQEQLRKLRLQQRVIGSKARAIDLLGESGADHTQEYRSLAKNIAETEKDLAENSRGLATLDDYLERLSTLLSHPERAMGVEPVKVRLDRMNVVREGKDETEMGREVEFLRGRRYDQPGRVIMLIRFPRSEIIAEKDRLAKMERYVNL